MVNAGAMLQPRYVAEHWKKSLLRRYLGQEKQETQGHSGKVSEATKRRARKRSKTQRNSLKTTPPFHSSVRSKGESYNNNALPSEGKHHGNARLAKKRRKISSPEDDDDGVYSLAPVSLPPSRPSPRPSHTVVATFHQRSGRRGLSVKYRGYQCTSMALAAIIVSKTLPLQNWRTPDLDAILRYGDLLHADLLDLRGKRQNDPRLALHEIPTGENNKYTVPVPDRNEKWFTRDYPIRQFLTLSKSEDYYGLVHPANTSHQQHHKDLGYTIIEDAIDIVLQQDFDGVLITVGDVSGSVFKDSAGKIKYFDSHSNNKWGRLSIDGTAVLLTFDTIRDFVRLVRKREPRISYRYELIGLKVHVIKAQKNIANLNGNSEEEVHISGASTYGLPKHADHLARARDNYPKEDEEKTDVVFRITLATSGISNVSQNITDGTGDIRASIEHITDHTEDKTDGTEDIMANTGDKTDGRVRLTDGTEDTVDCNGDIADGTENTAYGIEHIAGETEDIADRTDDKTDDIVDIAGETEDFADRTDTADDILDIAGEIEDIADRIDDKTDDIVDIAGETEDITDRTDTADDILDIAGETEHFADRVDTADDSVNIAGETEDFTDRTDTADDAVDIAGETEDFADRTDTADDIVDIAGETEDIADRADTADAIVDIAGETKDIADRADTTDDTEDTVSETENIADRTDDVEFITYCTDDISDVLENSADITEHKEAKADYTESITDSREIIAEHNKDKTDGIKYNTCTTEDIVDHTGYITDGIEHVTTGTKGKTDGTGDISYGTDGISHQRPADDATDDPNDTASEIIAKINAPTDIPNNTANKEHFGHDVSNDGNDDADISIDITENCDITTNINEQISDGTENVTNVNNLDNESVNTRKSFFEITNDGIDVTEVIDLSE